jgi:hypothetical protein
VGAAGRFLPVASDEASTFLSILRQRLSGDRKAAVTHFLHDRQMPSAQAVARAVIETDAPCRDSCEWKRECNEGTWVWLQTVMTSQGIPVPAG